MEYPFLVKSYGSKNKHNLMYKKNENKFIYLFIYLLLLLLLLLLLFTTVDTSELLN